MAKRKKKKSKIDLMDIAVGVGIAFGLYKILVPSASASNRLLSQDQIDLIFLDKLGVRSNPEYGAQFNEAWAMALNNGSSVFNLGGKNYSSLTGKAL